MYQAVNKLWNSDSTTGLLIITIAWLNARYHNHSSVESIQILPLSCFCYYIQVHISMRPFECTELWLWLVLFKNQIQWDDARKIKNSIPKKMLQLFWSSTYCWKCLYESLNILSSKHDRKKLNIYSELASKTALKNVPKCISNFFWDRQKWLLNIFGDVFLCNFQF